MRASLPYYIRSQSAQLLINSPCCAAPSSKDCVLVDTLGVGRDDSLCRFASLALASLQPRQLSAKTPCVKLFMSRYKRGRYACEGVVGMVPRLATDGQGARDRLAWLALETSRDEYWTTKHSTILYKCFIAGWPVR